MDRYGENKTQRLYRCCSNYALIVDNGLKIYGEGRTQISLSSPTMICSLARLGIDRIDRVYTDIKIANNTKSNYIMVSFTDHYNAIFIDRLPQKLKLEKVHDALIILFYVSPSSPPLQSCFKENAKILSKNYTTQ